MRWLAAVICAALSVTSQAAWADSSWFSRDTFQGVLNIGLGSSSDISSWTAGGFGKSQLGRGVVGTASLEWVWQPQLTDAVSLVVDGISQAHFDRPIDLAEAYVLYKPLPASALRVEGRAGLLYLPVSLEHNSAEGEPWLVEDSITPSAINTWIGEEAKALGVEGRVERTFALAKVSGVAGVFSHNDTAGTLLALRGWAFSNLVATAFAHVPLPPLSDYAGAAQSTHTEPVDSVDGRPGAYGKLTLTGSKGSIDLSAYDNNAQLGAGHDGQWAWRTSFYNVGAVVPITAGLTLSGQAMDGRTRAQLGSPSGYRFDVRFRAAYLRLVQTQGSETFTVRADVFQTRSAGPPAGDPFYHPGPLDPDETYSEDGWSALAAWKHRLSTTQDLLMEVLTVHWKRNFMTAFGVADRQTPTTVQVAYRKFF